MPGDDSLELFPDAAPARVPRDAPLAERMRPRSLDEVMGQEALLGPGMALRALADAGRLPSLILWGHRAAGRPRWRGCWPIAARRASSPTPP
jgi:putative ATPase